MTADEFRKLALDLPEVVESSHQNHPDFRIGDKILATLGPEGDWAVLNLAPEEQRELTRSDPATFERVEGSWGIRGYTRVLLETADSEVVGRYLKDAWTKTATKKILRDFGGRL